MKGSEYKVIIFITVIINLIIVADTLLTKLLTSFLLIFSPYSTPYTQFNKVFSQLHISNAHPGVDKDFYPNSYICQLIKVKKISK